MQPPTLRDRANDLITLRIKVKWGGEEARSLLILANKECNCARRHRLVRPFGSERQGELAMSRQVKFRTDDFQSVE